MMCYELKGHFLRRIERKTTPKWKQTIQTISNAYRRSIPKIYVHENKRKNINEWYLLQLFALRRNS